MEHFSDEVWADFVRGVAQLQSRREVELHLSQQCPECMPVSELWKNLKSIAANESGFAPPDAVVRMVRQELSARHVAEPAPWTLARLVFDSLAQPLPAGVRSGASAARQLLFDAEGAVVHLVLDLQPQSQTVSLVGQVTDKDGKLDPSQRVTVMLWTDNGQPLAEVAANELGEFQMEFIPHDKLHLSVEIAGRKPIRIPAMNLTSAVTGPVTKDTRGHN